MQMSFFHHQQHLCIHFTCNYNFGHHFSFIGFS